jgi:signal transduction histidine kinase
MAGVLTDSEQMTPARHTGRWLQAARIAWYIAAAIAALIVILSVPGYLVRRPLGDLGAQLVYDPTPLMVTLNRINLAGSLGATLLSLGLAFEVVRKRPDDGMALLLAFYLLVHGVLGAGAIEMLEPRWPGITELNSFVLLPLIAVPLIVALLTLFPDGRFVPRWTRWLVPAAILPALAAFYFHDFIHSTVADLLGDLTTWLGYAAWVVTGGVLIYALVYRYRHVSTQEQRQQTKWVLFGLVTMTVLVAGGSVPWGIALTLPRGTTMPWWVPLNETAWFVAMAILPLSLSIAILRYRLWDIDVLINRALVYGALTASTIGLYIFVVGYLGGLIRALDRTVIEFLTTGLVAVLFQPLRERLQRGVNRLMYGERDDPYAVLSGLGTRLEATLSPEAVLPTVVETVAEALKLPYVALAFQKDGRIEIAASYGLPTQDPIRLPLAHQSEPFGQLVLAPRSPGEFFSPDEWRLLEDIAHQAGAAAHAVLLTQDLQRVATDLQRSRERLVTAREEERRRIRRDLHDGLGPQLASLTLKLDAARNLLNRDPVAADGLLVELKAQTQAAIADIRRLVYDLRPPALDDLGLVGALREYIAKHDTRGGLRITFEAPDTLPSLPAAAEVAAYRIVMEALTNVMRHSRARTCMVRLSLNGGLQLEIADDGVGMPGAHAAGVGLNSMQERAGELGGLCVVEGAPGGGTRVWAQLPLGSD